MYIVSFVIPWKKQPLDVLGGNLNLSIYDDLTLNQSRNPIG